MQYRLPYHKADQFYRGTDVLLGHQRAADPVSLLCEYIARRDQAHGCAAALFLTEEGTHPTRSWFDSTFFSVLDRDYGGHSARAGGATFYASLGLSEDIIQAVGRRLKPGKSTFGTTPPFAQSSSWLPFGLSGAFLLLPYSPAPSDSTHLFLLFTATVPLTQQSYVP